MKIANNTMQTLTYDALMKKRLQKLKKHLPKKSTTSVDSPVYVGDMDEAKLVKPTISKMVYNADSLVECVLTVNELATFKPEAGKHLWLNVHGVHDVDLIKHSQGSTSCLI